MRQPMSPTKIGSGRDATKSPGASSRSVSYTGVAALALTWSGYATARSGPMPSEPQRPA
jgi:hypothetical protein